MPSRRLLGVFAHPDDEVFCVGGTLARYVADGAEAMVVSATRGEAGQVRDAAVATRQTLGAVREGELREGCARLGVQHVRLLDHVDGSLRDLDPGVLSADVASVIDEFRPDAVFTFGPDGLYGHPDHIAISAATTEAFEASPRDARLYHSHFPRSRLLILDRLAQWLVEFDFRFRGGTDFVKAFSLFAEESTTMRYASDHIDVRWFPPGVYIVEQGEPATCLYLILSGDVDIVQEGDAGERRLLRTMGPGQFFGELGLVSTQTRTAHAIARDSVTCLVLSRGRPTDFAPRGGDGLLPTFDSAPDRQPEGATTAIDVSRHIDKKVAAIAAHRSQFPIEPEMFPPDLLSEMMGCEYFVRVHPPVALESDLFLQG